MTVIPFSLTPKPDPVTVIELPGLPRFPLSEIIGEMENGTSSGGLAPDTSMKWVPAGDAGTVSVLVQDPWELEEGEATTVTPNLIGIPLWLALKPSPSIVTSEPGAPVALDNETVGIIVKPASLG